MKFSYLIILLLLTGASCNTVSEKQTEAPKVESFESKTALASHIKLLQEQGGRMSAGSNKVIVEFFILDGITTAMRFPYTELEEPFVFLQNQDELLPAMTRFGEWDKENQTSEIIFRSTDPDKIVRDVKIITKALYGDDFFEDMTFTHVYR